MNQICLREEGFIEQHHRREAQVHHFLFQRPIESGEDGRGERGEFLQFSYW
jgi:hypothetical protein